MYLRSLTAPWFCQTKLTEPNLPSPPETQKWCEEELQLRYRMLIITDRATEKKVRELRGREADESTIQRERMRAIETEDKMKGGMEGGGDRKKVSRVVKGRTGREGKKKRSEGQRRKKKLETQKETD